jgi:hypothetical protein
MCVCKRVYNRSTKQTNACGQSKTRNLKNLKVCYDFIFNVQISDSHISVGFVDILLSPKGALLHVGSRLSN